MTAQIKVCHESSLATCDHDLNSASSKKNLNDELDVVLEVAVVVVVDAEAVGDDPHLHGPVGAAGEDVVGQSHLDLHDARAQVPEERLAGVFVWKRVERRLRGQAPNLYGPLGGATDKAVLGRSDSQGFNRGVVGLEALALLPVGQLQDADPALPPTGDEQLLPGRHGQHGGTRLVATKSVYEAVRWSDQSVPQTHIPVVCRKPSRGNEGRGADENQVVSRLVVTLKVQIWFRCIPAGVCLP